jgi:hypothetical protein
MMGERPSHWSVEALEHLAERGPGRAVRVIHESARGGLELVGRGQAVAGGRLQQIGAGGAPVYV